MYDQITFDFWDSTAFRKCTKCKEVKPFSDFHKKSEVKSGITAHCIACVQLKAAKRRKKIGLLKMKYGCIDCGYNAHPAALHFDHIDREKKDNNVGKLVYNKSLKRIFREIRKCEIRCANCHSIKTIENGEHLSLTIREEQDNV